MSDGPCFDYCSCAQCWYGWARTPRAWRIINRLEYLVTDEYSRLHWTHPYFAWLLS